VNGINLKIEEGETFISSAHGGGKTTLLMTLMGFSNTP
jgi:ABC-type dipeptide/oligopeptide/nickel transport system ATPase subunit